MSNRVSDLVGIGQIVRELRLGLMSVLRYRSGRTLRQLKDDEQRLKNEEQQLKNQERKLRHAKEILALARSYNKSPEDMQALVGSNTANGKISSDVDIASPGLSTNIKHNLLPPAKNTNQLPF